MKTYLSKKNYKYTFIAIILIAGWYFVEHPSCGEHDKLLQIPSFLDNSEIIFEHPMAYVTRPENEPGAAGKNCSEVGILKKFLISIDSNSPNDVEFFRSGGYVVEFIPAGTRFTVIKRVYTKCDSFVCIDSGSPGDTFVLQGTNGELVTISTLTFKNLDRDYSQKPWNAGYYKGEKRIGDVVVEETQ